MNIVRRALINLVILLGLMQTPSFINVALGAPLNVKLTVKDVSGVGANRFPVKTVAPLPYGKYQNTEKFHIVDQNGKTIPAQFEVLNRWWAKDNSLRHIVVHFQPQVGPYSRAGTGQSVYWLRDDGGNAAPKKGVTVDEKNQKIVVDTGQISFTIIKAPFSIQTPKGKLQAELKFWDRVEKTTRLQKSFDRNDIKVEIEERGPMRAVVKISAPTIYKSVKNHQHGWAIRIYAYAGRSFLKVDYQLQNSAKNAIFAAPLYFKSMNLVLETADVTTAKQVRASVVKKPADLDMRGFISTGSVQAIIRNFTQMWPNGLDVTPNGKLSIELWPDWGEKYYRIHSSKRKEIDGQKKTTSSWELKEADKYWLDDMQHVYKEILLNFGDMRPEHLSLLAEIFQYPPVVSLPVSWYKNTSVTLDMGGVIPFRKKVPTQDLRKPDYKRLWRKGFDFKNDGTYLFGWAVFAGDTYRKNASSITGGWPFSGSHFIATENPADYYQDLNFAIGELNMRPQWIAGYSHNEDQARLKLTANPYSGSSWRSFNGHGKPVLDADYLEDSKQNAHPRDDQHGWFYHVEEMYYLSGNLWIKDWYKFVGEFRKTFLNRLDPYPDDSNRAVAHALNHAIQAYRITGDVSILNQARDRLIPSTVVNKISPITGVRGIRGKASAFQIGYLSRSLIDLYEELGEKNQGILDILTGFMNWNLKNSNFSYYIAYNDPNVVGSSNGSGFTLVDPQLWIASKLGRKDLIDHALQYFYYGLNGGAKPAGKLDKWEGSFEGRLFTANLLVNPRPLSKGQKP